VSLGMFANLASDFRRPPARPRGGADRNGQECLKEAENERKAPCSVRASGPAFSPSRPGGCVHCRQPGKRAGRPGRGPGSPGQSHTGQGSPPGAEGRSFVGTPFGEETVFIIISGECVVKTKTMGWAATILLCSCPARPLCSAERFAGQSWPSRMQDCQVASDCTVLRPGELKKDRGPR
jgi:hypothetical protein